MKIEYWKVRDKDGIDHVLLVNDRGFMLQVRQWCYADDYSHLRRRTARNSALARGWQPINFNLYESAAKIDSYKVDFKKYLQRRPKPCK